MAPGWPAIVERKFRLDGSTQDFRCERLLLEPGKRAVLRYEVDREWRIAGTELRIRKGTVTIAHYWADRPYNVYHWVDLGPRANGAGRATRQREGESEERGTRSQRGRTIGYYCNVAEPGELRDDLVSYTDLVVDVLLDEAGRSTVLDEEDLPADLAPERRALVARALDELTGQGRRIVREIEQESRRFL